MWILAGCGDLSSSGERLGQPLAQELCCSAGVLRCLRTTSETGGHLVVVHYYFLDPYHINVI